MFPIFSTNITGGLRISLQLVQVIQLFLNNSSTKMYISESPILTTKKQFSGLIILYSIDKTQRLNIINEFDLILQHTLPDNRLKLNEEMQNNINITSSRGHSLK